MWKPFVCLKNLRNKNEGDIMIIIRYAVTAFLRNNKNILLIKRSADKKIAPNLWSGVGGHVEQHEMNNPLQACYREVEEEAGIVRRDIRSLDLLYILIRRRQNEIRVLYNYFGETSQNNVIQTDEGELHWIPEDEMLEKEYSQMFNAMLLHYKGRKANDNSIYAGISGGANGKLNIQWSLCTDFEK